MEKCSKCGKDFEIKDLFLQWTGSGEDATICEDCIKQYKEYDTYTVFAKNDDMTFVFVKAYVRADSREILLSETLITWYYGAPNEHLTESYFKDWLNGNEQTRKSLLQTNFTTKGPNNEEVLY